MKWGVVFMYHAAIIEDEMDLIPYLRDTILENFNLNHVQVSFDTFSSGEGFLDMFQAHYHYDIVFLDIEMPDMDGIEVCRQIRRIAPDTLVVFISNKEELVFQTFEVQPFRFVRKSQYQTVLPSVVTDLCRQLVKNENHIIKIIEPVSNDIYSFDINQILYIESQRKDCRIVSQSEETILRCKLMDLEKLLLPYHFLKTHRSYLVNCKHIFHIGKNSLFLTDHTELPVSRNKIEEIKQQYLLYTIQ